MHLLTTTLDCWCQFFFLSKVTLWNSQQFAPFIVVTLSLLTSPIWLQAFGCSFQWQWTSNASCMHACMQRALLSKSMMKVHWEMTGIDYGHLSAVKKENIERSWRDEESDLQNGRLYFILHVLNLVLLADQFPWGGSADSFRAHILPVSIHTHLTV